MKKNNRYKVLAGIGIIIVIFALLVPFASQHPDGFDHVAEKLTDGNADNTGIETTAPFEDYGVSGIESRITGNWIAGTAGILTVFALGIGLGKRLSRRKNHDAS